MTKTIRWCALIGVLVLTAGLAACAKDEEPAAAPTPTPAPTPPPPPAPTAPTTVSFTGTVSNVTGARIAGARITVLDGPDRGLSIESNANGDFRFPALTVSNANFSATSGGYREVRGGTYVDGTNTLNFVFTQASLTGTVSDTDGMRLSGAIVTVLDGPAAGQSVGTDSNGGYRFEALNVANANLVAMKEFYDEDRRGTFVNGTNTLNFSLVAFAMSEEPTAPAAAAITITARLAVGGVGGFSQEWEVEATSTVPVRSESYDWDYGDGASSTNTRSVERHIYRKGDYTVKVSAAPADGGARISATLDIRVE